MSDLINIEELYENAPCGYFSFLPDGKIIKANKTFLSWIGITQEELASFSFVDLLYKGNTIYYEMIFLPMLKMQGFLNEINFDIIKKDGTTFPGLINAIAVRDDNHNLRAVNVTLIDITTRKKYEQELLSAKKEADNERLKFEILSNQIPAIIWTSTDSGQVDFLNKQYYKATNKPSSIDKKKTFIFDLIYEKDIESFKDKWDDARKNNEPIELEVRLKNRSKNPDWFLLRGVPFIRDHFAVDKKRSWIGTLTNINHQIKSLQLKDDFISIASHELKTPITIVKSYLEILQEVVKDETQFALIKKCESGINSMHQLINNLLDITHISSEELPIHRKKENLTAIIKKSIANYEIAKNKPKIDLIGDTEPIYVFADKMRIEQVINNLLSNAVKYSPGADKVVVGINKNLESGKVGVFVKDFGIGIPDEDINKVFDRYYRVKSERSPYIKGWGLGLFIIQQIIKSHNSIIMVESELGKGSCFSFELEIMNTDQKEN